MFDRNLPWRVVSGDVPGCPIGTVVTLSIRGNLFDVSRPWAGVAASVDLRSATVTLVNDGRDCVVHSSAGEAVFTRNELGFNQPAGVYAAPSAPRPLPSELVMPTRLKYLEGRWSSPGYRSGRMRAYWAEGFFALILVGCIWQVVLSVQGVFLAGRELTSNVPAPSELDAFLASARTATTLFGFCIIALMVALLAWLSRSVEIVPPLAGGTPGDSPRMSMGWWFVPIIDFWKPYTVLRELWDRLSVPARPPGGLLVEAYWVTLLGGFFVDKLSSVVESGSSSWATIQSAYWISVVGSVLYVAAAIFGFVVVREIQARADIRAKALGFDGRPASLPFEPGAAWAPSWPVNQAQAVPMPIASVPVAPMPAAPAPPQLVDTGESLRKLNELREQGLVTEDEYTAKRTDILNRL